MRNRLLLRPQFSLRMLLLFTLVVSLLCAMLASPAMTHRREVAIAEQIEALGGRAFFAKNGRPWGSAFFSKLGFADVYLQIAQVDLVGKPQLTSKQIEFLSKLNRPTVIKLSGTGIDDDAFKTLVQLDSLVTLDLSGTKVTEKGLYQLANLPHLEHVQLSEEDYWTSTSAFVHELTYDELRQVGKRIPIDVDKDVAALVLRNCRGKLSHFPRFIRSDESPVVVDLEVDDGDDVFGALPHLIELALIRIALFDPNNADKALPLLSKATELESLILPYNHVDGKTLRAWETLTQLSVLNLRNSATITDEDVPALLMFRDLRVLNIGSSDITAKGANHLLKGLAKLKHLIVPKSLEGSLEIESATVHYCFGSLPTRKYIDLDGRVERVPWVAIGLGNESLDWSIPGWKSTYHAGSGEVYVFEQQ